MLKLHCCQTKPGCNNVRLALYCMDCLYARCNILCRVRQPEDLLLCWIVLTLAWGFQYVQCITQSVCAAWRHGGQVLQWTHWLRLGSCHTLLKFTLASAGTGVKLAGQGCAVVAVSLWACKIAKVYLMQMVKRVRADMHIHRSKYVLPCSYTKERPMLLGKAVCCKQELEHCTLSWLHL